LVTGAEGNIAHALCDAMTRSGSTVLGTTRRADAMRANRLFLDLADEPDRWSLPDLPIDIAFLCAAVTSQEQCGAFPERTRIVNVLHQVELATRLVARGAFVVFISTNLVFDGQTPLARADHSYGAQTAYGQQKAEAEQRLLALGDRIAIVRLGKVITPSMPLFDGWTDALRARRVIHPFEDLSMAPVGLPFVIEVLCRVAAAFRPGIVHATATHDVTYAQAAAIIARRIGAESALIEPMARKHSDRVAAPRHAALYPAGLAELGLDAPPPERAFDVLRSLGSGHHPLRCGVGP
jgi:dTDP-4-dehydrorhamnose reductase